MAKPTQPSLPVLKPGHILMRRPWDGALVSVPLDPKADRK